MAKKKRTYKKRNTKKRANYVATFIGLILIVIGVLGFGFGPVGNIIKKCSLFLVGELWLVSALRTL